MKHGHTAPLQCRSSLVDIACNIGTSMSRSAVLSHCFYSFLYYLKQVCFVNGFFSRPQSVKNDCVYITRQYKTTINLFVLACVYTPTQVLCRT